MAKLLTIKGSGGLVMTRLFLPEYNSTLAEMGGEEKPTLAPLFGFKRFAKYLKKKLDEWKR